MPRCRPRRYSVAGLSDSWLPFTRAPPKLTCVHSIHQRDLVLSEEAGVSHSLSPGASAFSPGSSFLSVRAAPSLLQLLKQEPAIAPFEECNLHKIVSKFIKGTGSKRKPVIKECEHAFTILPLAEVSSSRINKVWTKTAV